MSLSIINKINNCKNHGVSQCNGVPVEYNKTSTGGNNPTITKSIRLSEYVATNRYKRVINNSYSYLDNRGLVFEPIHKVTVVPGNTEIVNNTYIKFPYEKIYITCIQRNLA